MFDFMERREKEEEKFKMNKKKHELMVLSFMLPYNSFQLTQENVFFSL